VSPQVTWIVLPAYNEAAALPSLLNAIAGLSSGGPRRVLVVDDGSGDGTGDVARRAGPRVVRCLAPAPSC